MHHFYGSDYLATKISQGWLPQLCRDSVHLSRQARPRLHHLAGSDYLHPVPESAELEV